MERRLVTNHSLSHRVNDSFTLYRKRIVSDSLQLKVKSFYSTGVLLRVRSTRISAVCMCLHDVSLPVCIMVIANDIIKCELMLILLYLHC
jgi:hypothetical protein